MPVGRVVPYQHAVAGHVRILTSSWPTVVLLLLDATVLQQPVPLPVLHPLDPLDPLNDAGAVALGYVPQPGTSEPNKLK